jgi:hypothetical protein
MGYRGLLLNAPYKIDSMMEMMLMWIWAVFRYGLSSRSSSWGAARTKGKKALLGHRGFGVESLVLGILGGIGLVLGLGSYSLSIQNK